MTPHDLIQKHLDASLTATEAAALAAAMQENPALAEEFAAASRMDAALSAAIREETRTALYTRRLERTAPVVRTSGAAQNKPAAASTARRVAAAAGIAALLGGAWWAIPQPSASPALPVAEKKKAAPRIMESAAPAFTGSTRMVQVESAKLRHTLRQFHGTSGNVRAVPVSQALAGLESSWKEHAEKDIAGIPIRLSEKARQRYTRAEDEPLVSLEIPGVSLLANLNLLAAQAGLKVMVTDEAITLEPDPRGDDGTERTWTLPLDQPTLTAFIDRAGKEATLASWMPKPQPIVLTSSFIQQPETSGSMPMTYFDVVAADYPAATNALADVAISEKPEVPVSLFHHSHALADLLSRQNLQGTGSPNATDLPQAFVSNEVQAVIVEESDRINLNLVPEVTEFEGFINYSPLSQAMAAHATYHPATLLNLLAAHGLPSGASYDAATGQITAKATLTQLRAASAALEAVREAATAGCIVKFRVIKWPAGREIAQATGQQNPTEMEWRREMDLHGGTLEVSDTQCLRAGVGLSSANIISGKRPNQEFAHLAVNSFGFSGGAGVRAEVVIELNFLTGYEVNGDSREPVMQNNTHSMVVQTQGKKWQRYSFPATGDAAARTVLLSIEPAQVPLPAPK